MNEDAAQLAVKHHPAVFLGAALVPEKIQDAWSDLRRQRLIEVVFGRHEVEQPFPCLTARVETVCDVELVEDGELLVLEAQTLGTGDDLTRGAILGDGVHTQLLLVGLPQGVPATFFYSVKSSKIITLWINIRRNLPESNSGLGKSKDCNGLAEDNRPASTMIINLPLFFRRLW